MAVDNPLGRRILQEIEKAITRPNRQRESGVGPETPLRGRDAVVNRAADETDADARKRDGYSKDPDNDRGVALTSYRLHEAKRQYRHGRQHVTRPKAAAAVPTPMRGVEDDAGREET